MNCWKRTCCILLAIATLGLIGSAVGFGVMDTSAVTSGVASPGCGVSAGRGVAVTGA